MIMTFHEVSGSFIRVGSTFSMMSLISLTRLRIWTTDPRMTSFASRGSSMIIPEHRLPVTVEPSERHARAPSIRSAESVVSKLTF